MDRKKIAVTILAIVMAYHEISQIYQDGHKGSAFSLFNFSDNVYCNPETKVDTRNDKDCIVNGVPCYNGIKFIEDVERKP